MDGALGSPVVAMEPVERDGMLTVPDAPPRPKRADYASLEAFDEAVAERGTLMAERRKLQKRLHDKGRDRTGRARPSEEAKKLTPEAKRVKSAANKSARGQRRKVKVEAAMARRGAEIAARWAIIDAKQRAEREAFLAQAAARVKEQEERAAARAALDADAAPFPRLYRPAPQWFTDTGSDQYEWCRRQDRRRKEAAERYTARRANAATAPGAHVDCVRCGQLFQRSGPDDIRCTACRAPPEPQPQLQPQPEPQPESQQEPEQPETGHESDTSLPAGFVDYADVDPIDRTEGAYFSTLAYRDEAEREAFLD